MPGKKYASIQNPKQYRALRKLGYSKRAAAMISNGRTAGHTVKAVTFTPPDAARNAAKRALQWRREGNRGGTAVGVARARDLAGGRNLSRETVGRMRSFFARHGTNRAAHHTIQDGKPSPWRVAWDLWGGDAGRSWVEGLALEKANYGAKVGEVISGNLARGQGGQFTSAGGAAKPKPKPKTAARQERASERQNRRDDAQAKEDATRADEDARIAAAKTPKERAALRREIASARRERAAERRAQARQERDAEREARTQEDTAPAEDATPEAPKGGGGGGGGKSKPTDEEKQAAKTAAQQQRTANTAQAVGVTSEDIAALTQAAEQGGASNAALQRAGLIDDRGDATDAGRRALRALERGDVRGYRAAVQDAQAKQEREATSAAKQAERDTRQARQLDALARLAKSGKRLSQAQMDRLVEGGRATREGDMIRVKAELTVYKTATGSRWVGISSTAYQDRDGEWVTRNALQQAAAYGDATGDRGNLRYWHLPIALGTCDYQATAGDGAFLIESGLLTVTPKASLKGWQLSLGFVPVRQTGAAFDEIRIIERSLVPPGMAINDLTAFAVAQEDNRMHETQLKALTELVGEEQATALLEHVVTLAKAQQDAGRVAKAEEVMTEEVTTDEVITEDTEEPEEMLLSETEIDLLATKIAEKLAGMMDGITTKMTEIDNELKGRGYERRMKAVEETAATLTKLTKRLDTLEALRPLAADGYRASGDAETVVKSAPQAPPTLEDQIRAMVTSRLNGTAV